MKNLKKYGKEILEDRFRNNFVLMTLILFSIEMLFKIMNGFPLLNWSSLRILLGVSLISLLVTSLTCLIKKRWIKNIVCSIFVIAATVYAWLQLGFMNYLGVYISFNTSSQFGAVKDYMWDYLASFKWTYYFILLPLILYIGYLIFMSVKQKYKPLVINKKTVILPFLLIILSFIYYGTITWNFLQNKYQTTTNADLFRYASNPSLAVNQFGTSAFGALDIKSYLFPKGESSKVFKADHNEEISTRVVSNDLKTIADTETNSKYLNLHNYFLSQNITDYNEYTGMFKDKNVIVMLLESVNETIINEEYFPNYYKMYSEGWHWTNSYSPRNSCATGNNEFSAMTGLYSIYNSCTANIYKNNTYFESIFNLFNRDGYSTTSMHDFSEWYYSRPQIHANMGSGHFYNARELGIETASYYGEWPSDEEFFDKASDIVLKSDGKWMTWLSTVTSHQPYTNSSTYGDLYKDFFKEKGYSTAMSRYLSKLKVLDNAFGLLLNRLESAGELDDTVIVLFGDHYPYGLNKSTVAETIKHDLSDYEIERTPFLIYNSEMEPKEFKEYTSYINIVPTLANLMGFEFDPRLYAGTDLLSEEYQSRVVFADGSWKNEIAYYNSSTGNIKYYTDKVYTEDEVRAINNEVSLKISMSNSAIKNNYFAYINDKMNALQAERDAAELQEAENILNTDKED